MGKRLNSFATMDLSAIRGILGAKSEANSPRACQHVFGYSDPARPGRINGLMIAERSAQSAAFILRQNPKPHEAP
jgi:hypothetical protein